LAPKRSKTDNIKKQVNDGRKWGKLNAGPATRFRKEKEGRRGETKTERGSMVNLDV